MPTVALVLYGSRARGEQTEQSDVDLLAVTRGEARGCYRRGRVSVTRYPFEHVVGRARAGDLFAYHIVSEGRVVYECEPVFQTIVGEFALRPDYSREIELASDVGWFLLHHRDRIVSAARFSAKLAWCTHTMLVARAAGQRRPVFSTAGLAAFARSPDVALVLGSKRCADVRGEVIEGFRRVLARFGAAEPVALPTLAAERRRFEAGRNRAGVSVVSSLASE
jgi:nucleotidyltransferase-like protein